ncbi:MAG: tRNA (adenosine(37)-N6)-threonylcarbamoyltransferase complex dimerization subunit type 1 TsaB [Hyphomicrobiaceae bacterium]
MKILAFDTCFGACSVALLEKGGNNCTVLGARHEPMQRGHAEALLLMIEDVLKESGCDVADLNRIAVTHGPGTFTGVRVGIAAARALALATGCELVGVGSLEAIAGVAVDTGAVEKSGSFAVVLDARREQVYLQTFSVVRGQVDPIMPQPVICHPDDAGKHLHTGDITLVGSGGPLVTLPDDAVATCVARDIQPDARAVSRLAATRESGNETVTPLYLRPPDAKPQTGFALERAS